jgi:DNA-binding MarR family transcriptional regulator
MAVVRKPPQRARRGNGNGSGNGNGNGNGLSRIDLGPLNSFIGYALRRAQIVAFTDFLASLRELKLRPVIFGVLMIIDQNPGLPQSQICSALGIQKANFGPLLSELEERKLAVRHEGVHDRRSYALHLTPAGKELLRRARALHGEHEARLAKRLGAGGRTQLLKLLERLNSLGGTGIG